MLFWNLYHIIQPKYIIIQRVTVFRNFKFECTSVSSYHRLFLHSRLQLQIQFLQICIFNRNINKLFRFQQLCYCSLFWIRIISNSNFHNSYQYLIISFLLLSNVPSFRIFSISIAICKPSHLRVQLIISFIRCCCVLLHRIVTCFLFLSTKQQQRVINC